MAWEKRGTRKYFYRSVRVDGHVRKVYFGAGSAGSHCRRGSCSSQS